MLKADLHIHTNEDAKEKQIKYNAKELIDKASKEGFEVLSFTFHDQYFYPKDIVEYANKKGILLIPGIEKVIEGKDVLIYNIKEEELEHIKTIKDLKKLNKNSLVIAPHPYFILSQCLGKKLEKNIDLFDGIEYSFFYNKLINRNKKAIKIGKKFNKPIIGNSDLHDLRFFNRTFTYVNSKKNINDFIKAIKKGDVKIETKPLSFLEMARAYLLSK